MRLNTSDQNTYECEEAKKNYMLKEYLQREINKRITGENQFILYNIPPSVNELSHKFQDINEMGIYLHIPFCTRICPAHIIKRSSKKMYAKTM